MDTITYIYFFVGAGIVFAFAVKYFNQPSYKFADEDKSAGVDQEDLMLEPALPKYLTDRFEYTLYLFAYILVTEFIQGSNGDALYIYTFLWFKLDIDLKYKEIKGIPLLFLGLAAMDGFHIQGVAQDKRNFVFSAKISDPILQEHALDADRHVFFKREDQIKQQLWFSLWIYR